MSSFFSKTLNKLFKNYIHVGIIHFRWNLFHSPELGQREIKIQYMNKRLPLWWHKTKILFWRRKTIKPPYSVILLKTKGNKS